MKLIAHRANRTGPGQDENTISSIRECLDLGLNVEIDVRWDGDSFWLGHDEPIEKINVWQLIDSSIWCHAKTVETFMELVKHRDIQTFFQDKDEVCLTSNGYFWCHSDKPVPGPKSILTDLSYGIPSFGDTVNIGKSVECYAICTDYAKPWFPVSAKQNIKLIILDIDGVMTNGLKTYDRGGHVVSKTFADRDFTAIKRFLAANIQVVFLTGDLVVNQHIANTRKIPIYHTQRGDTFIDKKEVLGQILEAHKVSKEEVVFVGDDFYDILLIEELEHTYCPNDAIVDVRSRVKGVLPSKGGEGVVAALYNELRSQIPVVYPFDSPDVNPK